MDDIPVIDVAQLLERYEGFLFDAYGVLVGDDAALPGAAETLARINAAGKPWFVLTNSASRLPETAARRYAGFGLVLPPERILTSGLLIEGFFREHGLRGARCRVLGTEDSRAYVARAGGEVVAGDFDVLVVCDEKGFPFLETLDDVLTHLFARLDRGGPVTLVLPNPDLIYPTGQGFGVTAGSIALMIEAALTLRYGPDAPRFLPLGKPQPGLFEEAARRAGTRRLVMLGDQLETDIAGAAAFGIDSVWVGTGVSARVKPDLPRPTWRMASLAEGLG